MATPNAENRIPHSIIAGATGSLGRALAEQLASEGRGLILIARDPFTLDRMAGDLRIRYEVPVECLVVDLKNFHEPFFRETLFQNKAINFVSEFYMCIGCAATNDSVFHLPGVIESIATQNFTGPVKLINAIAQSVPDLRKLVVVSSISASISRIDNAAYSASKAALESYCKSLALKLLQQRRNTNVLVVRLGYMASRWTFGLNLKIRPSDPHDVARFLIQKRCGDFGISYFPNFWRYIHFVIRNLPWQIYKRLIIR